MAAVQWIRTSTRRTMTVEVYWRGLVVQWGRSRRRSAVDWSCLGSGLTRMSPPTAAAERSWSASAVVVAAGVTSQWRHRSRDRHAALPPPGHVMLRHDSRTHARTHAHTHTHTHWLSELTSDHPLNQYWHWVGTWLQYDTASSRN